MRVVLLGTAAGGGLPQWNCACALCTAARDGRLPSRTRECAAITGNGRDWWLLNTSPDLRVQLTSTPALWPDQGARGIALRGVLLTDGEAHHVAGLAELCGTAGLKVYAPPPVRAALGSARAALDRYTPWEWADSLAEEGFVLAGGLVVTARPVGARIPPYVPARAPAPPGPWATAYRVEDLAGGGVLVYAPYVGDPSPALDDLCAGADCVLLDGAAFPAPDTQAADRRTPAHPDVAQAASDPLPGTGPDDPRATLARPPGPRRIHTRLSHTSPLLDPRSPVHARLTGLGAEVLPDGAELVV
ncbi:MBL fold metallo-hydrolase [Streptomyces achromogenes]|uniref:MBL fold metallo-hydrolase n=1 Tax=Streptomyces achromogenes TaxID=67255 RepID=UPI0036FE311B